MMLNKNNASNITESFLSDSSKVASMSMNPHNDIQSENFEYLLKKVNSLLISKQYKSAIAKIKSKEDEYDSFSEMYFILFDIKMKCYLKLIANKISYLKSKKKKIQNYNPNMNNTKANQYKKKLHSVEKIFSRIKTLFTAHLNDIRNEMKSTLNPSSQLKKEIVIQNYAMTLYLQATLLKNNNQIQDAIALLSIAHNLLSNYSDNCIDASTLSIHQRILLLLSTLLIEDKSYITAIKLNKISLRLCLKEIFFRNFYKKSKTEHNYININNDKNIGKTIRNIVISLYHIGISSENIDDEFSAVEAYRQAKWISETFASVFSIKISRLLSGTFEISLENHETAVNKQKKIRQEQMELYYKKDDDKQIEHLRRVSSGIYSSDKFISIKKYLASINQREMKKKEANTINSLSLSLSSNKYKENGIISSVIMYNDLLSEDYESFVNSVDDLNFNKTSRDTKIQLERYNLQLMTKNEIKKSILHSSKKRMKSARASTKSISRYFINNNFTFSKKFILKRKYLELVHNKELKFQKKLLQIKNNDNKYQDNDISEEMFDKRKIENNADILYKRINDKVNEEIKAKNKKYVSSTKKKEIVLDKLYKLKTQCQNALIVSLNSHHLEKLRKIEKNAENIKKEICQKNLSTTTSNINSSLSSTRVIDGNIEQINKQNSIVLSSIINDINAYNTKEKYINKLMNKK